MEANDPRLTLGRFLRDVAAAYPERSAVVSEERSLSYRELEVEARLLARALVGKGVVKGARVALLMANRPEWMVAAYAVGMLGAVLVPVNTFSAESWSALAVSLQVGAWMSGLMRPSAVGPRPWSLYCAPPSVMKPPTPSTLWAIAGERTVLAAGPKFPFAETKTTPVS